MPAPSVPDLAVTAVLSPDLLAPDECAVLRARVAADPALAATFRALDDAECEIRRRIDADGGEHRCLLVLLALDRAGRADTLDAADRARLDTARPALTALVAAVPALDHVLARIADEAADFEAAWNATPAAAPADARHLDRSPRDRAPARPPVRRAARMAWRAVALTAVVVFAVASGLLVQRDRAYLTAGGDRPEVLLLAGGTTIHAAAGAQVVYPDPARETILSRPVRLTGDAYFEVAHTGETFRVETPTATVTVLGTVFGIRSGTVRTEVTLVEGTVDVRGRAGGGVLLAPGEQTTIATGAAPSTPSVVDVPEALGWSGLDVFRDTPLDAALARLAARSGQPITADARLAGQRVTGTFEASRPVAEVLEALAVPLGARVDRTADGAFVLR